MLSLFVAVSLIVFWYQRSFTSMQSLGN